MPEMQNQGIGGMLIEECLYRLEHAGASGCVVLGEPEYYCRFGFEPNPRLTFEDVPPEYFQAIDLSGSDPDSTEPTGAVTYHSAFYAQD